MATTRRKAAAKKGPEPSKQASISRLARAMGVSEEDIRAKLKEVPSGIRSPRTLDETLQKAGDKFSEGDKFTGRESKDFEAFAKTLDYDINEQGWKQRAYSRIGRYYVMQKTGSADE